MWISIERNKLNNIFRRICGILTYLYDDTYLRDCKFLDIVEYPVPEDLVATSESSSSIRLTWANTSIIYGISIERRTAVTEFTEIIQVDPGMEEHLDEDGLLPGTQYFYRIRYFNGTEFYEYSTEVNATTDPIKYGLEYNWYAVSDARNICSAGSHVPNEAEWDTLITYLGGSAVAGGKVKEMGLIYWNPLNIGATNEVGFNGRGAGYRSDAGIFSSLQAFADFTTSTFYPPVNNRMFVLRRDDATCVKSFCDQNYGISLRPLKDSTTLTHGQTGTYTGNDGKVYRTICIGTQEWVADNIAETKYRNGDLITEITDNATWAARTEEAMCAYENNHDYI